MGGLTELTSLRYRVHYSVRFLAPKPGGALHTIERTDFPILVRELRDRLGLTQEKFAQELGVSFSTVNVWENGKRVPLPFLRRRLLELARAAGVSTKSDSSARRRKGDR
jgi:DNA-binding XRE family transcriptional regulator